jgi:hypothetical protein
VPTGLDGAPAARGRHVAEWTGTQMFVWGGSPTANAGNNLDSGGLYDPVTRVWMPTSLVDAPSPRQFATSVYTGDAVIVWGGLDGGTYFSSGAAFDLATNTWKKMSDLNAPEARAFHSAVWTGSEMIVFGGQNETGEQIGSGGRYNPSTNAWTATAPLPPPSETRMRHTAVWDGSSMLVYGGFGDVGVTLDTFLPAAGAPGGRIYSPSGNSWGDINTAGEPGPRDRHVAVWDGMRMLVHGGFNGSVNLGEGFKLESDVWAGFNGTPPSARREHRAVYLTDGSVMMVWGGIDDQGVTNTGAVFTSETNMWSGATPTVLAARVDHSMVSTGAAAIVWGGFDVNGTPRQDGGVYTP